MSLAEKPIEVSLTRRQAQILTLLDQGLSTFEVAERLHLTWQTVRWHLKRIYRRLEIPLYSPRTREIALSRAKRWRLIPVPV